MSPLLKHIGTLLFGIVCGCIGILIGLKGRKDKIKREADRSIPADHLLGAYAGTVQDGWWMFVLFGSICIILSVVEFVQNVF